MIAAATPTSDAELSANYDRHLHAAATAALSNSKYGALRKLNCRVFDGVVEIFGNVGSFYLKQLAQAAVLQLDSTLSVRNCVEVNGEPSLFVATSCQSPAAS